MKAAEEFSLMRLYPLSLGRLAWLQARRGWGKLWRAPGVNARFLIATAFFWSGAMALTEPYKALYLSRLGLSNLAIGGFFALDMGLRVVGVVLGGFFAQRYGHKTTLLLFDFLSWTIPSLALALATEPWHVYVATCLTASNAFLSGSVMQLLVEGTPEDNRTSLFALFTLTFVIPGIFLPAAAGWAVETWGVVPAMRVFFGVSVASTLAGGLWRMARLTESKAIKPKADLGELMDDALRAAKHLVKQVQFGPVLACFLLANLLMNLGRVYQGLFLTKGLGLSDGLVGWTATTGSAAFCVASLFFVPKLKAGSEGRTFFHASWVIALPALALAFTRDWRLVLLTTVVGGAVAAVHGAILSERLANLFPRGAEGLAHALLSSVMQAAVALGLMLSGALFETRLSSFPYVTTLVPLAMAAFAWRLSKLEPAPVT